MTTDVDKIDKAMQHVLERISAFGAELNQEGIQNIIILTSMLMISCTGLRAITEEKEFKELLVNVLSETADSHALYKAFLEEQEDGETEH